MMTVTRHHFTSQRAPCGKIVDADDYEDRDDEALLTQEIDYQCGCVSIQVPVPRRQRRLQNHPP